MKKLLHVYAITLLVLFCSIVSSCKKSYVPQTYAYSDTFNFHYDFYPDVAGGWTPTSGGLPGWFPNTGTGTSSAMGNATLFFTVYAKYNAAGTGSDNIPVPVNKYYKAQLAAAGITVPDDVTAIVYDNQQNSIWLKAISLSTAFTPPTTLKASGELDIIGGTGKFVGAKGHITQGGSFDAVDTTKGFMGQRGTITY